MVLPTIICLQLLYAGHQFAPPENHLFITIVSNASTKCVLSSPCMMSPWSTRGVSGRYVGDGRVSSTERGRVETGRAFIRSSCRVFIIRIIIKYVPIEVLVNFRQ